MLEEINNISIGAHDLHPETKVVFLSLTNPDLLEGCDLEPDDFTLWSGQWEEITRRYEASEEVNMFKSKYGSKFQLQNFILDNAFVPEREFSLYCSQIRNNRILKEAQYTDSLTSLKELLDKEITAEKVPSTHDQLSSLYDDYSQRVERRKDGFVGLKSGHSWMDQNIVFDRGKLATIAARPGQGKSSLALTLALDFAHNGNKVLFLALEMSDQEILYRALSQINNVPLKEIFSAKRDNIAPLIEQFTAYTKSNFRILSPRRITTGRIRKISEGFDVVVVDQLSNLADKPSKGELKVSLYGRMVYSLQEQARLNSQQVILCAQINRQGDSEPQLIHLKDSGAIEEASDKVLLLHCEDPLGGDTKITVGKNRQGQENIHVNYQFKRHFTKFVKPI